MCVINTTRYEYIDIFILKKTLFIALRGKVYRRS
jgi:hypothetical protein